MARFDLSDREDHAVAVIRDEALFKSTAELERLSKNSSAMRYAVFSVSCCVVARPAPHALATRRRKRRVRS